MATSLRQLGARTILAVLIINSRAQPISKPKGHNSKLVTARRLTRQKFPVDFSSPYRR